MKKIHYSLFFLLVLSICHKQVIAIDMFSKANVQHESELDTCTMPKLNKQVRVIKSNKNNHLLVVISSSSNAKEGSRSNGTLVESIQSNDLKKCMLDGFGSLSCGDSSFTIDQNVCDGSRYYVQETLDFTYNEKNNGFYLTGYKQNRTDKIAAEQDPNLIVYSKEEIGQLTFQELTRDLLNLITLTK